MGGETGIGGNLGLKRIAVFTLPNEKDSTLMETAALLDRYCIPIAVFGRNEPDGGYSGTFFANGGAVVQYNYGSGISDPYILSAQFFESQPHARKGLEELAKNLEVKVVIE